jgi:ribosome biogenesis GTPase A
MTALISWYPGHIAKAEKALREQLKRVDVVLEVRDARIPLASSHPKIATWVEGKSHLLVMNRVDMIDAATLAQWTKWFKQRGLKAYFTNAQSGKGVQALLKASQAAGEQVNERRRGRGMLPRPVRAVVIGFPNVGKSALINRLLNSRAAESSNRPGVTRQLRWIRISDQIELLDTPGILPPLMDNQEAALKLAICDDIGGASYDNSVVSAAAIEQFRDLDAPLMERYGLDPSLGSGMDYLIAIAAKSFNNDGERAARAVLQDFRKGRLGLFALEFPN